jgi:hypothetical protein
MNINDDKKVDILLSLLNERYDASHKMRERSLNFAIWILGFGIAVAWMLLRDINLSISQKVILTIFIVIIGYLTRKFLLCIEAGFNANKEVMITLEEALECYEQNKYMEGKSLYPEKYRNSGCTKTSHFKSLYEWIWVIIILLTSLIWLEQFLDLIKKYICK